MAVKASCTVTLSCYRDTKSVTRYYKLQSSTASAPSKPTANPPSGWTDAEPSYTSGSTNTLYFCDLTVFSDGTWAYSTVSKSSSYEAAKEAWNKAQNAQDSVDSLEIGGTQLLQKTRHMDDYTTDSNISIETDADNFGVATFSQVDTLAWNNIDTSTVPLTFSKLRGKEVTFSLYVRSDDYEALNADTSHGLLIAFGLCTGTSTDRTLFRSKPYYTTQLSSEWQKIFWTATLSDAFFTSGSGTIDADTRLYMQVYNYSVYSMQVKKFKLEYGNKATDWSPAPEDVDENLSDAIDNVNESIEDTNNRVSDAETLIAKLEDTIAMLVTDGNGTSLMTQTAEGWTFNIDSIQNAVDDASNGLHDLVNQMGSVEGTVEALQQAVNDLGETAEYVKIVVYEDEPCIELGESDSEFKLLITNTRIMFREGSNMPTYINSAGLVTKNISVEEEIRQGGFVWRIHGNGNLGLIWKGVDG